MSAELCGIIALDVILPRCLKELQKLLDDGVLGPNSTTQLKGLLLALCHSISSHGKKAMPWVKEAAGVVVSTLLMCQKDESIKEAESDHNKTILASIDCLALMAHVEYDKENESITFEKHTLLAELLWCLLHDGEVDGPFSMWGIDICKERMLPTDGSIPSRILMGNVLLQFFKMAPVGDALLQMMIPDIALGVKGLSSPLLRSSCIQILFVGVYQTAHGLTAEHIERLLSICCDGLKENSVEIKMSSLKLLGALLSRVPAALDSSEGLLQERVAAQSEDALQVLGGLAAEDESTDVRALASQLAASLQLPAAVGL